MLIYNMYLRVKGCVILCRMGGEGTNIIIFSVLGFSMIIEPFDERAPTIYNPVLHFRYYI